MDEYRKGDIVRIRSSKSKELGITESNLVSIKEINNDKVTLFQFNKELNVLELEAVRLNDKLIGKIYLDVPFMASVISPGDPKPMAPKPATLVKLLQQDNYLNMVEKYSIEYIHQLQHCLIKEIHTSWVLKIDRFFTLKLYSSYSK